MDRTKALPTPRPSGPVRFQRLRIIAALVIREMNTRFGSSLGGYFWAIAEPVGGIALLAIAFSLALRSPPLGSSFLLFYTTGMVPFTMYRNMANGVARAVSSNKGLLKYPVVTALDAVFAKVVLNFLTIFLIATILVAGTIIGFGLHVNLDLAHVALALLMAAALGIGVGTMNCVLFGFFPTWKNVWSVLNKPLFIVSGIFFLYESVPRSFQEVLWWNPLVHVIAVMRQGFYGTYQPQFVSYSYVLGLALTLFVVGAYLLRRHQSSLIEQ
jgi:capsular polysaccharide transport system permease protein